MCGIAGFLDEKASSDEIKPILYRMTKIITHRGPDDEGYFIKDGVGLGMRRLSIIDLQGGSQPIFSEDGKTVIIFNGEIYNYKDLVGFLKSRGHVFKSASDTEVVVHLYEEFGTDCVQKLRGMFAFAIWDDERKLLFLARDRLGIKPLYYAQVNGRLIFASEIKSIIQHPACVPRPDLEGLSDFLTFKYIPAPRTMFEGIKVLPPGFILTHDGRACAVKQYWDLSFPERYDGRRTEGDYAQQLEEILKESVKIHLMSDVPFGAFLSGGVDSSTVVALMSQFLNEPVKTFSVGYRGEGEQISELPYARLVAQRYHTDHHEVFVDAADFNRLMEKVVWHLDQPIADEACLATFILSEYASRHVKMVLTGEGGDELFAGYARYAGEKFSPLFSRMPYALKKSIFSLANRMSGLRRQKLALYALSQPDEVSRLTNWFSMMNFETKMDLMSEDLKAQLNDPLSLSVFGGQLQRTDAKDTLSRMLYVDTKLWLPDDLLARGDKMSMASSLEARVPILDHKLVEFAATVPPNLKVNGLVRKYLLKEVSRSVLPSEIIDRKKQGFPLPVRAWLNHEAKPMMLDLLSEDVIKRRNLFKPQTVKKVIDQHLSGFADHGTILWALINIELWYRLYIDGG